MSFNVRVHESSESVGDRLFKT